MTAYEPFEPRPIAFLGVLPFAGFRLRAFSIAYAGRPIDDANFARGLELAAAALPAPAVAEGRLGVGFVLLHQGRGADYVVVGWWDRENELPVRVFVRRDGGWRVAEGGESFCVWDLEIIAAERDRYVAHLLTPGGGGVEGYLFAETVRPRSTA